ncbi:MAG TPA: hypothetical protein VKT73_12860 [Xanthobacteraceae bacterium]|nr:hypothetical protein [Xanthobacteraceae bacterium]
MNQAAENPRAVIGGNNPPADEPAVITQAREAYKTLKQYLKDEPVVVSEEGARKAAQMIGLADGAYDACETERKKQVDPLNDQVRKINALFKSPKELLDDLCIEIKKRLNSFRAIEEQKRQAAADAAKKEADEARERALAAVAAADAAKEDASLGVESDVGTATEAAHEAVDDFKSADRQATLAQRDVSVRVSAGHGQKALAVRTKETLIVDDAVKAVKAIGATDDINEAIIKGARAYRKLHNKLPNGVRSETQRGY